MSLSELDLERALADLGAHLEYPATPDVAAAVATRLRQEQRRPAAPRRGRLAGLPRLPGWRRLAASGLVAALLAAAVLAVSPGTRAAVARRLGLRGVEIRVGGPPPTTRPGERLDLGLGERVGLDEARRRVRFPVLVPTAALFHRPDAVFVDRQRPAGGRVDLVYRARPGLPASPFTDAGLLVTQFQGQLTPDFIKKVVRGGLVERVEVGGQPGYWFGGAPHFFTFLERGGGLADEQTRLAGNTLVWQHGEQIVRLEAQLPREELLRVALSMR